MSLIPRALRPMSILRRRATRRGLHGDSALWRFMALVLIGGSPAVRTIARRDGFYGGSRFWKSVFYGLIVTDVVRKLTVKEPEVLSHERLTQGQGVRIKALSRKS